MPLDYSRLKLDSVLSALASQPCCQNFLPSPEGQYLLTGADVLAGRKFPDAMAACAWPVEQWDEAGAARFRYLDAGVQYQIPARSLRAAKFENLFMAGKTISADVDAIASARVMGCCLATGEAAGKLAADCATTSVLTGGAR